MTTEKAFGNVLREIRQKHSLSQEDHGFESGYHGTYISLLKRGREKLIIKYSLHNRGSQDLGKNRFQYYESYSLTT